MAQPDPSVTNAGSLRRSLATAMIHLEEASSRATRLPDWLDRVEIALEQLTQALRAHANEVEAEGGLLDDIRREAPRLSADIETLIRDHERLMTLCAHIDNSLVIAEGGEGGHVPSIQPAQVRHAVSELLVELTLHRQRGSDLVYDAYNVDIAAGD